MGAIIQDSNSIAFFKGDTLAYVNNILKNKVKYIGKPLSYLIKDIEYPIKSFTAGSTLDKRISMSISLIADEYNIYRKIGSDRVFEHLVINIDWQTPVSMDSINAIYSANGTSISDRYKWSNKAKVFFGKQIIKDLQLPDYILKQK